NDGSRGFDITLVAGADITTGSTPGPSPTVGPFSGGSGTGTPATSDVVITGPGATGGSIDFSTHDMTISRARVAGNNPGGNVRLIAYADSSAGTSGGKVLLSSGSSILTGGKGSGSDGNVTIIAGCRIPSLGPSLTTVSTGLIDTTGGTGGGGAI